MDNLKDFLRRRKTLILLAGLLLLGIFLRFWGLGSVYQRVDDYPLAQHIQVIYGGDWRPDPYWFYPIFFNYIVAVLLRLISGILTVCGFNPVPGLYPFSFDQILQIARVTAALMGSMTIPLVFLTARRLYSEKAALIAASLFTLSFIHILYSHQIVLDVPMTFFYALSLYFCTLLLARGHIVFYILAAFSGGLAVATKYNAIFIGAAIFAAHAIRELGRGTKAWRIPLDIRLAVTAAAAAAGFFAGHPYGLIRFREFLQASKNLIGLVHETEWFLSPIVPTNLWEHIKFSKHVQAVWNVFTTEGWPLSILIVLGIVHMIRKRRPADWFVAVSGTAYFIGALGFIGFSRLRDLATLALFLAFLGMSGVLFIREVFGRRKAAAILVVSLLLVWISWGTVSRSYYLWEDDTTEMGERWIVRNIPERTRFGKEWFSPMNPVQEGRRYRFFSRAYLFWRDFPPFQQFDFIMSSSASSSLFLNNRKFYPEWSAVYVNLFRRHEPVKSFFFHDIEYKNPEVRIFSGKIPRREKQAVSLPTAVPASNPVREFVMMDGSPYEKDINAFFIGGGEKVIRFLVNREKIPRMTVFVIAPESDGEIVVGGGLIPRKIKVRAGENVWADIRPARAFPFFRYCYRLTVKASPGLAGAFIRLAADDLTAGLQFFDLGENEQARVAFGRLFPGRPGEEGPVEPALYFAAAADRLGDRRESTAVLERLRERPAFRQYQALHAAPASDDEWVRRFERHSGVDMALARGSRTELVEDKDFEITGGIRLESDIFLNRSAAAPLPGTEAGLTAVSREFRLPPQGYQVEFHLHNPANEVGVRGTASVIQTEGGAETSIDIPAVLAAPAEDGFSVIRIPFYHRDYRDRVRFVLRLDEGFRGALDHVKYRPNMESFWRAKSDIFRPYLDQ
jgi:4-amino-4-deoxy-L-arabinose transferase-like glycosyltransferase